ncbi:putative MFS-type transporter YhjX [Actinomadura rubteroloni]|uniref:Putative MFS-type transporter YhjX n=1 Tax=Actinomadura rubteroloni TaxID=1926885 RepID=A0A2P4UNQ9_9ACTN|nr:OFA family MFS transporter [Actinomadura rubteroloni]POM26688.1 putative MFS-type transporter YhjX [Actinomadura rubteroloni]
MGQRIQGRHRRVCGAPRWAVACGAVVFQIALGGVYAWSVFAHALQRPGTHFGLGRAASVLPFSVAIGVVFVGTTLGGRLQDRRGPRAAALLGGALYSTGALLASLVTDRDRFWFLLAAYGVVGGLGLGIAYIVPVAMLQKWYPERRGLITGVAVGGFGFGAVLVSPVAQWLVDAHPRVPTRAFLPLGLVSLALTTAGAMLFRNPPRRAAPTARSGDLTCADALRTRQWYLLTAMLTLNTVSGIGFVAVTAGAAAAITGIGPASAAALTGAMGLANGAGRVLWGWLSERYGRMRTFALILALMGASLVAVPYASSPVLFVPLAAVVFACFGGGYAVMPATAADFFGLAHAGQIYGLMNVAWSVGGVVGPLLVAALAAGGDYRTAFTVLGLLVLAATALPALTRPPVRRPSLAAAH